MTSKSCVRLIDSVMSINELKPADMFQENVSRSINTTVDKLHKKKGGNGKL